MKADRRRASTWLITVGAALVLALYALIAGQSYWEERARVAEAAEWRRTLVEHLSLMKDAKEASRDVPPGRHHPIPT
jgi:hypothetical protein